MRSLIRRVGKSVFRSGALASLQARRTGRTRRVNAVTLHVGRCGSTVLGAMLGSHPEIRWVGELFHGYRSKPAWDLEKARDLSRNYLRNWMYLRHSPVFGCEIKYLTLQHLSPECTHFDLASLMPALTDLGFSKFVLLHRRNYLRRVASTEVARARGTWFLKNDPAAPVRVAIQIEDSQRGNLLEFFESMDRQREELQRLLDGREVLDLSYEDHVQDGPGVGYEEICRFLEVDPVETPIRLKRTNPFALRDVLLNFEEVAALLSGTPYEWMVE